MYLNIWFRYTVLFFWRKYLYILIQDDLKGVAKKLSNKASIVRPHLSLAGEGTLRRAIITVAVVLYKHKYAYK